jgi:hypothetical protein
MTAIVKSREVQRALLAEMAGDWSGAQRHFLAAAHLEMVLAADYAAAGTPNLAVRSRLSAGSCFWRGGQVEQARAIFDALAQEQPEQAAEVQRVLADLAQQPSNQSA